MGVFCKKEGFLAKMTVGVASTAPVIEASARVVAATPKAVGAFTRVVASTAQVIASVPEGKAAGARVVATFTQVIEAIPKVVEAGAQVVETKTLAVGTDAHAVLAPAAAAKTEACGYGSTVRLKDSDEPWKDLAARSPRCHKRSIKLKSFLMQTSRHAVNGKLPNDKIRRHLAKKS